MADNSEIIHETEAILPTTSNNNYSKITIEPSALSEPPKKERKESMREFLKTLGSVTSLPNHVNKIFSTNMGVLHQCIAVFGVLVLTAGAGHPIGFSAVLLPQLYVENSTMRVDEEVGSWIASVHSAASPVGSLMAGPIMERWGRRTTLELSIPSLIIGWIIIALSGNVPVLLIGRLFCGYGVGYLAAVGQVYLSEIADARLRGMIIGTPFVSYSIGVLIIYYMGNLPWRTAAGISVVLPVISYLLLFRMPESPTWLIQHGKLTRAYDALKWLRGEDSLSHKELHQILTTRIKEREVTSDETFLQLIRQPPIFKPLIIIFVFIALQLLSGTYIVIFYAVDIIQDVAGNNIDPLSAAIYTAVIRLIFTLIGCSLLLYSTRRTLCLLSGMGSMIASLTLGIFMLIRKNSDIESESLDFWVTLICIAVYISANTIGFMMLPSLMVGELLPSKIRGMFGGYIFTIFNIGLFILTKLYPSIKYYFGTEGLFLMFGTASLLGTIFLYLVLPETKNKSLLQIESYFKQPSILWRREKMCD